MILYMSGQRKTECATSSVDRVPGYEPVGRRFESCVARKKNRFLLESVLFLSAQLEKLYASFRVAQESAEMKGNLPCFCSGRNRRFESCVARKKELILLYQLFFVFYEQDSKGACKKSVRGTVFPRHRSDRSRANPAWRAMKPVKMPVFIGFVAFLCF